MRCSKPIWFYDEPIVQSLPLFPLSLAGQGHGISGPGLALGQRQYVHDIPLDDLVFGFDILQDKGAGSTLSTVMSFRKSHGNRELTSSGAKDLGGTTICCMLLTVGA